MAKLVKLIDPNGNGTIPICIGGVSVQPMGDVTHLVWYSTQPSANGTGIDRIVQARFAVPTSDLQAIGDAISSPQIEFPLSDDSGELVNLN